MNTDNRYNVVSVFIANILFQGEISDHTYVKSSCENKTYYYYIVFDWKAQTDGWHKLFSSRKSSDARDQDFIHLSNSRHELHNFFGLPICYSKPPLRPQHRWCLNHVQSSTDKFPTICSDWFPKVWLGCLHMFFSDITNRPLYECLRLVNLAIS